MFCSTIEKSKIKVCQSGWSNTKLRSKFLPILLLKLFYVWAMFHSFIHFSLDLITHPWWFKFWFWREFLLENTWHLVTQLFAKSLKMLNYSDLAWNLHGSISLKMHKLTFCWHKAIKNGQKNIAILFHCSLHSFHKSELTNF